MSGLTSAEGLICKFTGQYLVSFYVSFRVCPYLSQLPEGYLPEFPSSHLVLVPSHPPSPHSYPPFKLTPSRNNI